MPVTKWPCFGLVFICIVFGHTKHLLVLIELFSLGRTAEALRAIIGSKLAISLQRGPVDPKFQIEGVAPHQPFFFS